MAAARLSPAASLLRNSKLFALPPAIALPNPEPSSEPVPRSDTATSIYPTRAAIETTYTSLGRGDWGFKRPLPLKSTTKSGSPTVRLNKGIDTAEHIADFDSAADHVLTLKKFQELNVSIQHPRSRSDSDKVHNGVFRKSYDNTTNAGGSAPARNQYTGVWPSLSPSDLQKQMPKALQSGGSGSSNESTEQISQKPAPIPRAPKQLRWRYEGPSLTQMSGLEFDQWLKALNSSKRAAFREKVKQRMLIKKKSDHAAQARDEGTVGEVDPATLQIPEDEVTMYIKKLRHQPRVFGPLIADFLDLPDGPANSAGSAWRDGIWEYGRDTIAADSYQESGPPSTHPSAGLSYIHTARWAQNHAVFGPQNKMLPVVARQVKTRARAGSGSVGTFGLAGFIVDKEPSKGAYLQNPPPFEPQPGGQKLVVTPSYAEVGEKGALKLVVGSTSDYQIEDERAVHHSMVSDERVAALRPRLDGKSRVMQPLTRNISYKKRDDIVQGSTDQDLDILGKVE